MEGEGKGSVGGEVGDLLFMIIRGELITYSEGIVE
jgi:hypothetical protein